MAQQPYCVIRKNERLDEEGNTIVGSELFELWAEYRFGGKNELIATTNTFESIAEERKKYIRNAKVVELNKQKSDLMLIINDFSDITKEFLEISRQEETDTENKRSLRIQAHDLINATEVYLKNLSEVGIVHDE